MEKSIDLTNVYSMYKNPSTKVVVTCHVHLDKDSVLRTLMADSILIHGVYYKVPEERLLKILTTKDFGIVKLELEKI